MPPPRASVGLVAVVLAVGGDALPKSTGFFWGVFKKGAGVCACVRAQVVENCALSQPKQQIIVCTSPLEGRRAALGSDMAPREGATVQPLSKAGY